METDKTTDQYESSNSTDHRRATEHLKQIIETQSELALAGFDLQAFMNKVVERMLLLTPATGSVVEIAEGTEIIYKATSGSVAPFVGVRLSMDNSLTGLCLRDREIKISDDTSEDPRVDLAACKRVGAASMVLVPLMMGGNPMGVLKVLSNKTHAFSSEDIATLQLMAGLLSGALAQQLEMDARKKLEEALTERTLELESRNEQLINVLAELEKASDELERKNQRVEETTRLKSEFLANMSHEIRTPLNAIIGFTDILLRAKINNQERGYLDNIKEAGHGLLSLINDILDFSKIEAGKMSVELIEFDIDKVVEGAAQLMTAQCHAKGLRLVKTIDAQAPLRVLGDPERLRQILINLLSNAVKFSSSGSILLKVECATEESNGSIVLRFSVTDQGVGLSEEEIAKLFQPFVQADGSTTRKFGGTGLGLNICKHLVELMGGEIGIESKKGEGAKFWFTLPYRIATAEEKSTTVSDTVSVSKRTKLDVFEHGLILVADDHPANRMVAELQLRELGLSAHLVNNGREAVEAMKTNSYVAILMDCQMPDMDGFEAARQIRNLEIDSGKRVPIIAMTASAMQGDKDACIAAGMDDYASKPIELKQLCEVLGRWLALDDGCQTRNDAFRAQESVKSDVLSTIDLDSLIRMFGVASVCKLLLNLIATTDVIMKELQITLESKDRERLSALSHKLIGSCGTLRAWELHALSKELHAAVDTEKWDDLNKKCADIQSAFARLKNKSLAFVEDSGHKQN
ncbi:MAG: response regulator [Cyanobacteria bacterium SZAS-4]|nr:response regulator [Cyanobacteria bacterium SZAS-4]